VQSVDDLNFKADLDATLYDEVAMLTSEGLDGLNVADGGDPLPLTYGAGGAAGPTDEAPAVDGIAWSGVNVFDLVEAASYVGLLRGGVVHFTEKLQSPVGPGPVSYVHGIGPGAVVSD
jgi:hypothetical protein